MNQPLFRCILLAVIAGTALPVGGAAPTVEEAKQWLERMVQAAQHLNYEGTFVYIQGPHVEAMRTIHSGGEAGERQRLTSLTGPPREILATDDSIISLLPKQDKIFASDGFRRSRFLNSLARELDQLESQYVFELVCQDRVVGIETQVVAIKSRDQWRYGYRLWLDPQSGMLLRSALLDDKEYPVEQVMFTDFQIKPQIDASVFNAPLGTNDIKQPLMISTADNEGNATAVIKDSGWQVKQVPPGFVKTLHNRSTQASFARHLGEHMVFSDGLATISVFVERLDGAKPLLIGKSNLGSMNAFGVHAQDDYQILVVGEVPAVTVQTMATSIVRDSGAQDSNAPAPNSPAPNSAGGWAEISKEAGKKVSAP